MKNFLFINKILLYKLIKYIRYIVELLLINRYKRALLNLREDRKSNIIIGCSV